MGVVSWIVLGAVIGLLANAAVPGRLPGGFPGTVLAGVAGAFLGGAVFTLIAGRGVGGLDPVSLLIAFAGAAALLTIVRFAGQGDPDLSRRA